MNACPTLSDNHAGDPTMSTTHEVMIPVGPARSVRVTAEQLPDDIVRLTLRRQPEQTRRGPAVTEADLHPRILACEQPNSDVTTVEIAAIHLDDFLKRWMALEGTRSGAPDPRIHPIDRQVVADYLDSPLADGGRRTQHLVILTAGHHVRLTVHDLPDGTIRLTLERLPARSRTGRQITPDDVHPRITSCTSLVNYWTGLTVPTVSVPNVLRRWLDLELEEIGTECFGEWLAAQTDRDDPVGDLARDLTSDAAWTGKSLAQLKSFLTGHLMDRYVTVGRDDVLEYEVASHYEIRDGQKVWRDRNLGTFQTDFQDRYAREVAS